MVSRAQLNVISYTYNDRPLRLIMLDDEPWFLLNDVYNRIDYANPQAMLMATESDDRLRVNRDWLGKGKTHLPFSPSDEVWFVSEYGLFDAVLAAGNRMRAFKRWLSHELLPALRETAPTLPRTDPRDLRREHRVSSIEVRPPQPPSPEKLKTNEPHALYRFYGDGDELLYVGISWRVPERMKQHRTLQPWWDEVVNVTIESYPTKAAASRAEKNAIRTERPRYNVKEAA